MRKKITNLFLYTNTSTHAFCREKIFHSTYPFSLKPNSSSSSSILSMAEDVAYLLETAAD